MNHVLYGAFLPFLVCAFLYARNGWRAGPRLLVLGPLAMAISGFVAIIPDLPRLWGDQVQYVEWHHARWCPVAWGHCWIDRREWLDGWSYYPILFVGFGALILGVAFRELVLLERR